MADDLQRLRLAAPVDADARADGDLGPVGDRSDLGAGQLVPPVAGVAQHLLAFFLAKLAFKLRFERVVPLLDQRVAALRHQVRPGRDRQLELGLEMLLIALAAEGDAHGTDDWQDIGR